jgi:cell wall-associated NlpC family hydrolase
VKQEQAAKVKAELDRLDTKLEMAVEDYNDASARYKAIRGEVSDSTARLKKIVGRIDVLQTSLDIRAESMYRTGPLGVLDVLLGAASFDDFATTWDLLNRMNADESKAVAELRAARAEAEKVQADLVVSQAKAKGQYKVMTDRRRFIESEIARRKNLLKGIEAEIAALEAEEERRAQAELARWRETQASKSVANGWDWGDPKREPRSGLVEIAKRSIGRPYLWAAAGPDSFDCSGFTMFVYAQVGVSLPHSSRAQIGVGERVSRENLQPGDLVFFGRPIHHVGMYVGGGMMIHSPRTGDHVKIAPLLRDYSGASRP